MRCAYRALMQSDLCLLFPHGSCCVVSNVFAGANLTFDKGFEFPLKGRHKGLESFTNVLTVFRTLALFLCLNATSINPPLLDIWPDVVVHKKA